MQIVLSMKQSFFERTISIRREYLGLGIDISGYGDFGSSDGNGTPIFLDLSEDEPRLFVWADINEEDPTHIIPLDAAREDRRNEQE